MIDDMNEVKYVFMGVCFDSGVNQRVKKASQPYFSHIILLSLLNSAKKMSFLLRKNLVIHFQNH